MKLLHLIRLIFIPILFLHLRMIAKLLINISARIHNAKHCPSKAVQRQYILQYQFFLTNYLNPALEGGMVQMTIPNVPKSKNQRYIKR